MITDKVSIEETIPTQAFGNVRLRVEGTLEPGETELEAWMVAKAKINDAYQKLYGMTTYSQMEPIINSNPAYVDGIPPVQTPVKLEDEILSCTSLKVLESYKFIVKSKPELQEVYDKKMEELSK